MSDFSDAQLYQALESHRQWLLAKAVHTQGDDVSADDHFTFVVSLESELDRRGVCIEHGPEKREPATVTSIRRRGIQIPQTAGVE